MKHLFTLKSLMLTLVMLFGLNAWGETVEITTSDLVTKYGWTVSSGNTINTLATEFNLDDNIKISTTGDANCGSVWGTAPSIDWRLYQAQSGNLIVTALNGYQLESVTFTFTNKNTGALKDGSTKLTSGSAYAVSGTQKEFTVGNTGTAKNGQVKITKFSVTYTKAAPAAVEKPVIKEISIADDNGDYYTTSTAKATIACAPDATIKYAITDGAEPTNWSVYSAEVSINSNVAGTKILWAKAVKGDEESAVVSKVFTFIEKPELITYEQVTSESQIVPGRKYVIACTGASKMAVMNLIESGKEFFSAKNTDATTITYADNKLSFVNSDAVYVTFEKAATSFANGHANDKATTIWNVKIGDEYITSTAEKKMAMSADAPTNITMSIDSKGNFVLNFGANYFCYNSGSPRFTTYDSQGTTNSDVEIQLFREPEAMASVMGATAETAVELPVSVVGRKVFGNYLLASTVNNGGAQLESPSLAEAKHFWSNDPEKFNQESWIAIEGLDESYVGKEFEVGQTLTAAGADDIYGFPTYTVATPSTSDYAGALAINNYSASNFNIGGTDEAVTNVWLVVPQLGEYCQIHGYVDAEKGADATMAFVQANETSNVSATVYLNGLSEFKTSGWYNIEGVVAKDGKDVVIYATAVDTATGVEGVETSSVKVYGAEGVINVESEEVAPIAVYSANGAIVSSVEASSASIAVAPGFYIVKAGNSVSKVTVK